MLGSLGRLADHIALMKESDGAFEVSRTGRYVQKWLDDERWNIPLTTLPPDWATAHCVRDSIVRTYDVLALPTLSRWGGTLIGNYVNERGTQYNLLDTIFSATDEGVLSLAAIRDASGRLSDLQIVHLNQGAARLLKRPSGDLMWRRLSTGGNLLCSPDIIKRLFDVIAGGSGGQFEIDSEDRC